MASLSKTHQSNPDYQSLYNALDPISFILSQNPIHESILLKLTTESFVLERGPKYRAYAELRESRLRMRYSEQMVEHEENEFKQILPAKKQVEFEGNVMGSGRKGSSVLTQSVPDFSSLIRKENRKPLPSILELTPPPSSRGKMGKTSVNSGGGSKSASAGEKKGGILMARKSYANLKELKESSMAAASSINGEYRRGEAAKSKTVSSIYRN